MRSDNVKAFYALVKAGLWEKDINLSENGEIDFGDVCRLADEQSVVGLVAAGMEHVKDVKIPQEIALTLAGSALQLEQRNLAMNKFLANTVRDLRAKGIYTLLVKGQGVAQCYERPLWRACGDIDFYLSEENYKKAQDYLLPLSTSSEKSHSGKHLEMTIDGWVVEIHGWLRGGLSSRINRALDEVQRQTFNEGNVRSWTNDGIQIFMLGKENDVFYVFAHFLNHFYKGGIGLRQICDWCRLLWTYRDTLDSKRICDSIRLAGLMTEWKAFAAFAVEYLGMPESAMPFYSEDAKWKRKADRISSFILNVGNMGHNRDNSYYRKYPYVMRKAISLGRRCGDLARHAMIFPLDSFKFLPYVVFVGIRSASRGD